MKKIVDKIKLSIKYNKKIIIFLVTLGIIAIIAGSIFTIMLNSADKKITMDYINNFVSNISNGNLDYVSALYNGFSTSFSSAIITWLLGMSVIGIPVILFMYFSKIFVLGFSISAIISNYGFKGCLISFSYIFPHQIINIIVYTLLTLLALKVSGKILYSILKKEKLDFKTIMHNYFLILLICLGIFILTILFEVYITPKIISIFLSFLKLNMV